jgi:hypothetical protein
VASLLAVDLQEQWRVIEEVYRRVDERRQAAADVPATESLGYHLHNLHGACEQLFELIARAFEDQIVDDFATNILRGAE